MYLSFVSKEIVQEADCEKIKLIWMSCKQNAGERNKMRQEINPLEVRLIRIIANNRNRSKFCL